MFCDPEPVNMFSYMAEGTLQLWLKVGAMNSGDNMDYMAEPNLIMWVLKSRVPFLVVLRKRCNDRRIQEIGTWKGLLPPASVGFETRGEGPRPGVDFKSWNVLQPIARKNIPAVLQPLGTEFVQQPKWAIKQILHESLCKGCNYQHFNFVC